jgi:hypothetical protein
MSLKTKAVVIARSVASATATSLVVVTLRVTAEHHAERDDYFRPQR